MEGHVVGFNTKLFQRSIQMQYRNKFARTRKVASKSRIFWIISRANTKGGKGGRVIRELRNNRGSDCIWSPSTLLAVDIAKYSQPTVTHSRRRVVRVNNCRLLWLVPAQHGPLHRIFCKAENSIASRDKILQYTTTYLVYLVIKT